MNWHRLGRLLAVGMSTFSAIILAALVFVSLTAPTVALVRMLGSILPAFAI